MASSNKVIIRGVGGSRRRRMGDRSHMLLLFAMIESVRLPKGEGMEDADVTRVNSCW